jgi:tetratricopeptide (TPR) repeat protein
MKLKQQSLVSARSLNRMLQMAEEAWKCKDFQQNIELLERASRLDPANSGILLQLGRMYGLRCNYAAAERCFEKAVRIAPKKTQALWAAGMQSHDLRKLDLAERYLRLAVEQKDATPDMLINLADIYERLRRMDDANTLIGRALQANSACPSALLARARLDRQAGRLDEAERLLRSFPACGRTLCIRVYYELGAILDRQGRYDEAMSAFLEAKALLRPGAVPFAANLPTLRARQKEMMANISAEMLQRWFDFGRTLQLPHRLALLCGHPRSGTTLLEQVLDSHPDIISAEETAIFHDEVYFRLTRSLPQGSLMLSVLEAAQTDALQQSRANYFRSMELLLGNPIGNRLLIDKNPSMTLLIPAYIRVFPEIKLLVALRDPRDVCLSCFMQPFLTLNQTDSDYSMDTSAYVTIQGTVEEYTSLMDVWRTIAPLIKNPHLEVRYEDMVNDLESVAQRTLNFLGTPWDARVLGFDEHALQKVVRSPTYADVTKPVYKGAVGRWRHYQKYFEPCLEKLDPFVKAFGYE